MPQLFNHSGKILSKKALVIAIFTSFGLLAWYRSVQHLAPTEAAGSNALDTESNISGLGLIESTAQASELAPIIKSLTLRSGETIVKALLAAGVTQADITSALASLAPISDFRRLRPTDNIDIRLSATAPSQLLSLRIEHGLLDQVLTERTGDTFSAKRLELDVQTVTAEVIGQVRTSLWDAVIDAGENAKLVLDLVDIFAYDIDFYSQIKPADTFCLLVEKRYSNGLFVDYGPIQAAEITTGNSTHRAFLHINPQQQTSYYDEQGHSLRKQLLKAPLKYGAVTSRFGVRKHPVLGYTRNHNGIDYGVPTGTPVWAVGDGRVLRAGFHGGFGRLVEISHANGWISQYAHLSRMAVRPNQRVSQKQVIGYVGQTGLATGPHLHYGLKRHGRYVNALTQKIEPSRPLAGQELSLFMKNSAQLITELNKVRLATRPATLIAPSEG